ncbi:MAG: c-type cytochrome [Bacteroidales bacterium]|nr:c-type cytochrome [Bacteroidales bacterium]
MRKAIRKLMIASLMLGAMLFLFSTNSNAQDWTVPANYKSMKNPKAGDADAGNVGKALWDQHCKSCHGKEGYGDGSKADELDTELRDFSTDEVQSQTDGELYYKAIIGRDEMPNFEKKIPSEADRWLLINYIRTLKK